MQRVYNGIDKLWGLLSENVFVRFQFEMPTEKLLEIHQAGKLIFASPLGGFVEWLILSSWCRRQGMGAILVTNRKRILLFSKPLFFLQILFRQRTYGELFLNQEKGPRFLFCPTKERKRPNDVIPSEKILRDIYINAKSTELPNIQIVPVFILWRRHVRGEQRKLSEYFLGLSSSPNLLGKCWYLIRKRSDSTVQALAPLSFSGAETLEKENLVGETQGVRFAKSLRRKVLVAVATEMRIALGPKYHSPIEVKEEILRDPEMQKIVDVEAAQRGVDRKKVMLEAYKNLTEIAAHYRFRFVEVMNILLYFLFNYVFDGIDSEEKELQELRELMRTKPVVFTACHRSHLDYLVIPFLLFQKDLVTPHIVAGINLSFWPVGMFLRMGGAFFIRRSFRGDVLYSLCLRKYIEYLLKNRYNIKVFIEGTRSRSGKMLPPAYGILKMVMETCTQNAVDDIALVPTSLCYDEVLEEGSYTKELTGGQKAQESATGFLKSRKMIRRNIGKVYVHFGKPVSVKEVAKNAEEIGQDSTLMLQKTAIELSKRINDVTPVTPKSIVCAVLLSCLDRGASLEELLIHSEEIAGYVLWNQSPLGISQEGAFKRAVEHVIKRMQKTGAIAVRDAVPREYFCPTKQRIRLNFYKNSAMHILVLPAIAILALDTAIRNAKGRERSEQGFNHFVEEALLIRNLLKFEFFFSPTHAFTNEIAHTASFFLGEGDFKKENPEQWERGLARHFGEYANSRIYLYLIADIFESYLTVMEFFKGAAGSVFDKKALLPKLVVFAENSMLHQKVRLAESISTQTYSNALLFLENLGFLEPMDRNSVRVCAWEDSFSKTESEFRRFLNRILEV